MTRTQTVLAALAATLVVTLLGGTAEAAAGPSHPRPAAKAADLTTLDGGDVVTLASPKSVRPMTTLRSGWESVSLDGVVPDEGVGAVVLGVAARGGSTTGVVSGRATGSTGTGTTLIDVAKGKPATGLSVVKTGDDGTIQVSATGAPQAALTVVGWIPELSGLVTPETSPTAVKATLSTTAGTVTLAGLPADVTSVLVSVRTNATKAGRWTAWTKGDKAPTAGHAFGVGSHRALVVVRPDAAGRIGIRALTGTAKASVQVLSWSVGATTLEAVAPAAAATAKPKTLTPFTVAGRLGVPADAQAVALSVSAPAGGQVTVWSGPAGTGDPLLSAPSAGSAISLLVPVPADRRLSVKVGKVTANSAVTVTGFVSDVGGQSVSFAAKPGTSLLGPGDVASTASDGTVTLSRSAEPVSVGDHLFVRPPRGAPYLGVVETATNGAQQAVTLAPAKLYEAFDDYEAHFDGDVGATPIAGRVGAAGASVPLPGFGGWSCGGTVSPSDVVNVSVSFEGGANLDVSLADRSLDASIKGALVATATIKGVTVNCTVDVSNPVEVPIGVTGLALTFGGGAALGVTVDAGGTGRSVTLKGRAAMFAGYYYIDGESGGNQSADVSGSLTPKGDSPSGDPVVSGLLDLNVVAGISTLSPPGTSGFVDASASVTIGTRLKVGAPHPNDDPYSRELRGPRCIDASQTMYLELGAGVALPFCPDVSVTVARFETDPFVLYRGPCWGYSGSITYSRKGSDIDGPDPAACSTGPCGKNTYSDSGTKTLIPQVASFSGGGNHIDQPYTWSVALNHTFVSAQKCTTRENGTAGGSRTWGTGESVEVFGSSRYQQGWISGTNLSESVDVGWQVSGPPPCTADSGDSTINSNLDPSLSPPGGSNPMRQPKIALGWGQREGPTGGIAMTVNLNLTRGEYQR